MNTGEVTIVRESGAKVTIPAYIDGPLAVHPELNSEGWVVTHLRTGLAVVHLRIRERAIDALPVLLGVYSWDFDSPKEIPAERRRAVRLLVAEMEWLEDEEAPA